MDGESAKGPKKGYRVRSWGGSVGGRGGGCRENNVLLLMIDLMQLLFLLSSLKTNFLTTQYNFVVFVVCILYSEE